MPLSADALGSSSASYRAYGDTNNSSNNINNKRQIALDCENSDVPLSESDSEPYNERVDIWAVVVLVLFAPIFMTLKFYDIFCRLKGRLQNSESLSRYGRQGQDKFSKMFHRKRSPKVYSMDTDVRTYEKIYFDAMDSIERFYLEKKAYVESLFGRKKKTYWRDLVGSDASGAHISSASSRQRTQSEKVTRSTQYFSIASPRNSDRGGKGGRKGGKDSPLGGFSRVTDTPSFFELRKSESSDRRSASAK